uniref:Uncharacterized protein n=1 Tax=Anopheles arabiensis TaxID=7173 RepID=A0A182HQ96_ANOAR
MDDSRDTLNNSLREEVQQKLRQAKDLLKRVRDKDFCSGMKNSLVRIEPIILNSTIRLKTSTLLEVRKILEKGVQKTTSKLVLERYNANVPAWDTTDLLRLSGQSSRPNSHQGYSSMGNQERLALKYPRRKIDVAGHSSTSSDPGNTASRSSSPLFRRRHEVFPSQPIPTTYAEHKRLSQNQQFQQPKSARDNQFVSNINKAPVETDNQSINKIPDSTSHSPTHVSVPNETRYNTDKSKSLARNTESSFVTDVPTSANSPTSSHAVHVEKRNSEFSDHRDFKDPNSVDSRKTSCANDVSIERRNSEYSNLYKDKKYIKERKDSKEKKDSKDRKDSKERKNSKEKQDSKERKNSKESADSTTSNHVDADNRPQKVQSDTHTNGVNRDAFEITTTSCSPELHQQTDAMEDDPLKETAKVTNATSKPSKPKSKGHSRELHDLLSYTTEIMPKIVNRRKSISNETAVINAQLRAQFNITKELVVALTRVQTGVVAHRTRSKSIDSTKFLESRKIVEQITPETNTAARKIQISDTKEKKSVDQRKHKKSPEKKKSASSTSNSSSSSRMLRQTARKSSSKPETSASKKKTVEKKLVIESATTEIDKTPVKPKNISKKREIRSRSPSPSRPKRLRSSHNNSIVACKEEFVNKSSEETEDEEITKLIWTVAL